MNLVISENAEQLSKKAAQKAAEIMRKEIKRDGEINIVIATGAAHMHFYKELVALEIPWDKVSVFHLDEYIGISKEHKASFRKYIKDNFADNVSLKEMIYISPEADAQAEVDRLNALVQGKKISLGVIGIGENAHIAFNDPPADFENKEAYAIVDLDEMCRTQQAHEGWFESLEAVPTKAISATVSFIMQAQNIVSVVPYRVKANAVTRTLNSAEVTNNVPATILKKHANWNLFLDEESASLLENV